MQVEVEDVAVSFTTLLAFSFPGMWDSDLVFSILLNINKLIENACKGISKNIKIIEWNVQNIEKRFRLHLFRCFSEKYLRYYSNFITPKERKYIFN